MPLNKNYVFFYLHLLLKKDKKKKGALGSGTKSQNKVHIGSIVHQVVAVCFSCFSDSPYDSFGLDKLILVVSFHTESPHDTNLFTFFSVQILTVKTHTICKEHS